MTSIKQLASIAAGTAMFALATTPARAANTILDFDTGNGLLPPGSGQIINNDQPFTDFGVTIGTTNPNNGPLLLFNSNCGPDFPGVPCSGNDGDLASGPTFGSDPQGNVLIIHDTDFPLNNPNDDADGGTFEFSFTDDGGVGLGKIGILDLDENVDPTFTVFQEINGMQINTVFNVGDPDLMVTLLNPTHPNNNSLREFMFNPKLENVTGLHVALPDVSGAITHLEYHRPGPGINSSVPEPSSTLGLLALSAIGASTALKRKAKK